MPRVAYLYVPTYLFILNYLIIAHSLCVYVCVYIVYKVCRIFQVNDLKTSKNIRPLHIYRGEGGGHVRTLRACVRFYNVAKTFQTSQLHSF